MRDVIALLETWPYVIWSLGAASAFYFVVSRGTGHLSKDAQAHLSLYLQGDYKGSWAANFCALFDSVFGERHFSLKTFGRSAIASVCAVFAIYMLLGPILGVLQERALGEMNIWAALAIGAAVNILPDYLSLWETRLMLRAFQRVRNPVLQLGVLLLDLVF